MKLHNIAPSSTAFHYRKCSICKLTVKPGETIVSEGTMFNVHRACLSNWLDDTYAQQPDDWMHETLTMRAVRTQQKIDLQFNEYRDQLIERYGDATERVDTCDLEE